MLPNELCSDAARRASDIINGILAAHPWDDIKNQFVAIRLSDGGYDGTLYDSKRDAVRHQMHEQQCAYVCLRNLVGGSNPREMEVYLEFNRKAYAAGMRLTDPDHITGGPDIAITSARWDHFKRGVAQRAFQRAARRYQ